MTYRNTREQALSIAENNFPDQDVEVRPENWMEGLWHRVIRREDGEAVMLAWISPLGYCHIKEFNGYYVDWKLGTGFYGKGA